MKIELTEKEFRRLLDLVYIGNWILNSTRGTNRIKDYDNLESKLFSHCIKSGMYSLFEVVDNEILPSLQFADGGIHEAIMDYEDTIFYEILAEELARRDMDSADIDPGNMDELTSRIDEYIQEFDTNGVDNITLEK